MIDPNHSGLMDKIVEYNYLLGPPHVPFLHINFD